MTLYCPESHSEWQNTGVCVITVQRGDLSFVRGLVKFLLALAYLFCLALLGSCLTRFAKNKSPLCRVDGYGVDLRVVNEGEDE